MPILPKKKKKNYPSFLDNSIEKCGSKHNLLKGGE
jgi:hypothetical protein